MGKPIRGGGRKHVKARYRNSPYRTRMGERKLKNWITVVEINLRLPSMLHGKKGFERIVWACTNVLNHSVDWLFCDLQPATGEACPALP